VFNIRQSCLCRVSFCAECSALGKARFAGFLTLPSVALGKTFFAECPTKGTRQRGQHSAKPRIPVVIVFLFFIFFGLNPFGTKAQRPDSIPSAHYAVVACTRRHRHRRNRKGVLVGVHSRTSSTGYMVQVDV
jgi:hypothetical protein